MDNIFQEQQEGDSNFQELCFGAQGRECFHLLLGAGTNSSAPVGDRRYICQVLIRSLEEDADICPNSSPGG